jgi:hypothetical protein
MGFLRLGTSLEETMLKGVEEALHRGDIFTADGARFRLASPGNGENGDVGSD